MVVVVVVDRCFYVGDAAGRPNDHSDADLNFAQVPILILSPYLTIFRVLFYDCDGKK